jgi:hypothetical protein
VFGGIDIEISITNFRLSRCTCCRIVQSITSLSLLHNGKDQMEFPTVWKNRYMRFRGLLNDSEAAGLALRRPRPDPLVTVRSMDRSGFYDRANVRALRFPVRIPASKL